MVTFRIVLSDGRVRFLKETGWRVTRSHDDTHVWSTGITQDVTEQEEMNDSLNNAQKLAKIGSWRWSIKDDKMTNFSEEYARIVDAPSHEFLEFFDARGNDIIHPDDRDRVLLTFYNAIENNQAYDIEFRFVRLNGEIINVREAAIVIKDGDGNPLELSGLLQDITERTELDRMKSEFIAVTSHELRTPLTSLKGALSLINNPDIRSNQENFDNLLDVANRNAERLTRLVDDLLEIEKLEFGKIELSSNEIIIEDILARALREFSFYGTDRNVKFSLRNESKNIKIMGDEDRLMQVFVNLMSNAAKFSPNDDVVDICIAIKNGMVNLSFHDNGKGIPHELHEKIFDKFFQVDSSNTREIGGTGLGLNIARAIVERHGGQLNLESSPSKGTTFFFDLPIHA